MTSTSSRSVARLSSPGAILASIPTLCGFLPQDSVVLLSLRGPRRRLGLTVRLDLPPPPSVADAAELLAQRVAQDGAASAVVAVYSDERRPDLVDAVEAELERRGVQVMEALHVAAGAWTSYRCAGPCCPAEGTPVPPPPALLEAERALEGRAVLASRDELVRGLAPPVLLAARTADQALDRATVALLQEREQLGVDSARDAELTRVRALLDRVAAGGSLSVDEAAATAVALHDVALRDAVATWSLKRSDALLSLLEQVVRAVPPPLDAPACATLAWVAYARGDGSRANVALDRALTSDPEYSLARLLRTALDGALPPREIRKVLRGTKAALRTRQA